MFDRAPFSPNLEDVGFKLLAPKFLDFQGLPNARIPALATVALRVATNPRPPGPCKGWPGFYETLNSEVKVCWCVWSLRVLVYMLEEVCDSFFCSIDGKSEHFSARVFAASIFGLEFKIWGD
jgi:hypothetical protein